MSWASSEVVSILTFLLPGFVAAAVFYSLTSYPKPGEFERVVQALIFTIVVQAVVGVLVTVLFWVGDWFGGGVWADAPFTKTGEITISVPIAIMLGLVAVRIANNDTLHRLLRNLQFTRETSYPSEWYSAFSRHPDSYVVLHLKGERRLYGWPEEWPTRPDLGHFLIAEGEWLVDDDRVLAKGVSAIMVPASEVEMVEFLPAVPTNEPTE